MKSIKTETLPGILGKMTVIEGLLMLILGIFLVMWPTDSLKIGLIVMGAILVITGLAGAVMAVKVDNVALVTNILMIIVGLIAALSPVLMAGLLGIIFGVILILMGIDAACSMGTKIGKKAKIVSGLTCAVLIILGIVVVAFPEQTINGATWILGVVLVVTGLFRIIQGVGFASLKD